MLEEGDHVRCVATGVQGDTVLATTDQTELTRIDPLLSLKTQLGSIEKREFPKYYTYVCTTLYILDYSIHM